VEVKMCVRVGVLKGGEGYGIEGVKVTVRVR
jgi:hypothetical protein